MKTRVTILIILLAIIGCSKDYSDLAQMSVDYSWLKDQSCFDERSPEITLKNVPKGTEVLKVKMVDIDNSYNHGGGTVTYDGFDRIPVGALKNYKGPCPMMNMNPRYELRVRAIDGSGKVIGFGKTFRIYPPEHE